MNDSVRKQHPRSVIRKILAGFFLAFVAILLAFTITNYSFRDMMQTVEELSEPSEKLTMLNHVFQEITTLDQLQRAEAIRNPERPYNAFLNQSQAIVNRLDSMALLDWDTAQIRRIVLMKEILMQRDELFLEYLKLKSNLVNNRALTWRIDTLSALIEQKKVEIDTSVISTQKKTTTTYVRDSAQEGAKEDKNFFGKLFGSKKRKQDQEEPMEIKVLEELSIIVDTLAIAKQNKVLEEVEKIVRDLEADQRTQSKRLLSRELELINANSLFINQLLAILHEVERDELLLMRQKNQNANALVTESISRISILLLVFFLGAALLVYLIWMDMAKSNYYREQLERARDEAEELSKIKERFLANMSHEIRTPLQSILGFAEQIKENETGNSDAVNAIYSSSEHLLHIVNEVLDYSRISSGNFSLAKEPFDLLGVVREIESAIKIQADKKKLTLLLDAEQATNYRLSGDSFRLRQILYNIVGNAVKFTAKGFVKLTVRTREEDNQVHCEFEILDTGIGIRPEDLKKIFNQFEQANTSIAKHYGGTGLGLTIVKSLIEAQGGSLIVESEPGKGSAFTVRLTFEKTTDSLVQRERASVTSPSTRVAKKLLVVDDDAMILKLCGLILQKYPIEYTLYNDAEKLLHAPVDTEVTHILMDIRMPKINGVELCQAMRKKYPSTTQFIALTAHVFPKDRQALLGQGFDRALSKPFHEHDLVNLLGFSINQKSETLLQTDDASLHPGDSDSEISPDLTGLRKMTLHDEDLFQTVVHQFLEETQQDLYNLDKKLITRETAPAREIIHRLAGRTGQIGVLSLSVKLKAIENKIEQGETLNTLLPSIEEAKREVSGVVRSLQRIATVANSGNGDNEEVKVKK